jgi:hypothetical protein
LSRRRHGNREGGAKLSHTREYTHAFGHHGHDPHSDARGPADTADAESDSRVLGRLGRLGARRNGLVHLFAGAGADSARVVAADGHPGDSCERRLLRQCVVRAVPDRLGVVDAVGAGRRPLRARPDADVDDPVLFAVHAAVRRSHQHLAGGVSTAGRHRYRR